MIQFPQGGSTLIDTDLECFADYVACKADRTYKVTNCQRYSACRKRSRVGDEIKTDGSSSMVQTITVPVCVAYKYGDTENL